MKPPLSKYISFYRSDLMADLFSCWVLGGTLYGYVPRERVWFMKCSVLNYQQGIRFWYCCLLLGSLQSQALSLCPFALFGLSKSVKLEFSDRFRCGQDFNLEFSFVNCGSAQENKDAFHWTTMEQSGTDFLITKDTHIVFFKHLQAQPFKIPAFSIPQLSFLYRGSFSVNFSHSFES